jgi:hypothetical protein
MKEALSSSETSVLTRATCLNIPKDDILYSHRRENLKSYIANTWRMACSLTLRYLAVVRTDVSEERRVSIIRVTRIGEIGTTLAVTSNRRTLRTLLFIFLRSVHRLLVTANVPSSLIVVTLMKEALSSSETSVLTRATWLNIPKDDILYSHRRENLKSYIANTWC